MVSTLAGNGIMDPCSQNIGGRAQEGNLFIADMSNHSIRKLSTDGIVTTFAK
ncbi:MAG: hypothetical protein ABJA18_13785 [bacterium]